MKCHENVKLAEEWGLDRGYALMCRKRYLTRRLWEIEDRKEEIVDDAFRCPLRDGCQEVCTKECRKGLSVLLLARSKAEREAVDREIRVIEKMQLPVKFGSQSEISDEMIERARSYPVNQLVEFAHGKATAWCHDDRSPSLYFGTKNNLAICPVCDKKFNPIDILMDRDRLTFPDAVRRLA